MSIEAEDALTIDGIEPAKAKVLAFLQKACESLETEGELEIVLSQAAKVGSADVYETVYAFDEKLEALVDELVDKACDDAEVIGRGTIKYTIQVKGMKGRATFALKIPPRDDADEDDLDEAPVKRGLISQQMRHNEKLVKVAVNSMDKVNETLHRMCREKDERIRFLEKQYLETIKAHEELVSMKQVRDIELARFAKQEGRKDQVAHTLMMGIPILASKLLGGGKKEAEQMGGHSQLEMMLEGLLMTFKPEQLNAIMNSDVFTMPQKMALGQIIQFIMERQEAEKTRTNSTANGASAQPSVQSTPGGA